MIFTDKMYMAVTMANIWHTGQKDKAGFDYIAHPFRVGLRVISYANEHVNYAGLQEELFITAVLHDVLEDTKATFEDIVQVFGLQIAEAVKSVSRENGEIYRDFVERSSKNYIGRAVKIADLNDNLDPFRLEALSEGERIGMEKRYRKALAYLEG